MRHSRKKPKHNKSFSRVLGLAAPLGLALILGACKFSSNPDPARGYKDLRAASVPKPDQKEARTQLSNRESCLQMSLDKVQGNLVFAFKEQEETQYLVRVSLCERAKQAKFSLKLVNPPDPEMKLEAKDAGTWLLSWRPKRVVGLGQKFTTFLSSSLEVVIDDADNRKFGSIITGIRRRPVQFVVGAHHPELEIRSVPPTRLSLGTTTRVPVDVFLPEGVRPEQVSLVLSKPANANTGARCLKSALVSPFSARFVNGTAEPQDSSGTYRYYVEVTSPTNVETQKNKTCQAAFSFAPGLPPELVAGLSVQAQVSGKNESQSAIWQVFLRLPYAPSSTSPMPLEEKNAKRNRG